MLQKEQIKGILFDYGGTIDTNGVHWGEVLWIHYQKAGVPVSREAFDQAYIHGERLLGRNPIVRSEHNFHDLLLIKVRIQLEELIKQEQLLQGTAVSLYMELIAKSCYEFAKSRVEKSKPVLASLTGRYPLVLVSNFYGNIQTVLDDFGIGSFFNKVIESAVVGVRKPDPAIFTLGVQAMGFRPEQTVVVGDSYSKDIAPAKQAGCQTIWLNVCGWEQNEPSVDADEIITDINTLTNIFNY